MSPADRGWRRLFSALLGATPRGFRERNGAELLDAFERALAEAGPGRATRHRRAARECVDLFGVALRERARAVGDRLAAVSWIDVKLGVRMLAKYPGITAIGTFSLVVGIALAAGFFAFTGQFVRGGLPLDEGDRVVGIEILDRETRDEERRVTYDFLRWREALTTVRDVGAWRNVERNLVTSDGRAEPLMIGEMSATGFTAARVPPMLGRPLVAADERPGAPAVLVIGHRTWMERFGGDPDVVGREVRLGEGTATVVGVMPRDFAFPVAHQAWMPLRLDADLAPRAGPSLMVFGRLADGATLEAAAAEVATLGARMSDEHAATHARLVARVVPYKGLFFDVDEMPTMYLFQLIWVVAMLVVATNVATLMFARTASREAELAVRGALGASRRRMVFQLFVEALVLTSFAAVAALGLLVVGFRVFAAVAGSPGDEMIGFPFWFSFRPDTSTVLFTAGLAVACAVIVGVLPAVRVGRGDLRADLHRSAPGGVAPAGGLWTGIIVAQVALSICVMPPLLDGSNVRGLIPAEAPFAAHEVLAAELAFDAMPTWSEVQLADTALERARLAEAQHELLDRLRAEPGVRGVTLAAAMPGQVPALRRFDVEGLPSSSSESWGWRGWGSFVAVGFFEALGVPATAGRTLTEVDLETRAVVVNRSFVDEILGGRSAVGRLVRVAVRPGGEPNPWQEIVGVVEDLGVNPLATGGAQAMVYEPVPAGRLASFTIAVRVSGDPLVLQPRLREIVLETSPALRVQQVNSLDRLAHEDQKVGLVLAAMVLTGVAVALLLSTSGIYALMAFTVQRRTREIGIRTALGATPSNIVSAMLSRTLGRIAFGVVAGLAIALALGWADHGRPSFQYDATLYLGMAALLGAVALVACLVPARRGLRIEPTEALRDG